LVFRPRFAVLGGFLSASGAGASAIPLAGCGEFICEGVLQLKQEKKNF
jgi:hypothetical protein